MTYPKILKNRLWTLMIADGVFAVISICIIIAGARNGNISIVLLLALGTILAILTVAAATYKKALDNGKYKAIEGIVTYIEKGVVDFNDLGVGRPTAYHVKSGDNVYSIQAAKRHTGVPRGSRIVFYCPESTSFIERRGVLLVDTCWGYEILEEPDVELQE